MHFATADSRFEAYGHEVTISIDANIVKNVLGRRGWLDRLNVGIVGQTIVLCRLPASPKTADHEVRWSAPPPRYFSFNSPFMCFSPAFKSSVASASDVVS